MSHNDYSRRIYRVALTEEIYKKIRQSIFKYHWKPKIALSRFSIDLGDAISEAIKRKDHIFEEILTLYGAKRHFSNEKYECYLISYKKQEATLFHNLK